MTDAMPKQAKAAALMGYQLYREVRDYAPQDWTSGEMVVALMIADDARDASRSSWIFPGELARRCRMTQRGVRKNLEKLASKGYDFRVGHGSGKDGREVYAARDKPIEYVVPDILAVAASRAGRLPAPVVIHRIGGTTVPPRPTLSTG